MGISLIVSSVALAFLGCISLALWRSTINGTNQRNGSFGIRTASTMKNDAAWNAGHQAAAPSLRAFGYVDIGLALSLMAIGFVFFDLSPASALTLLV
ncbi:SdpI family protein [Corynebacterium capitovis]|uniref:SdpI family protein n=1 Tax=Corynebacterium capitovis TaxID=131081 RepID=UPI001FDEF783|nr:SdpI family protein [Corynebacterium capitovis]